MQDELAELPIHCNFIAESVRFREQFARLGDKDKAAEVEADLKTAVDKILNKAATVDAELGR